MNAGQVEGVVAGVAHAALHFDPEVALSDEKQLLQHLLPLQQQPRLRHLQKQLLLLRLLAQPLHHQQQKFLLKRMWMQAR